MRGVYRGRMSPTSTVRGSSPHARGLPPSLVSWSSSVRIIPACAGFTPVSDPGDFGLEDHPRMRGVYRRATSSWSRTPGSSPHARGLRNGASLDYQRRRIIPACAGFTPHRRRRPGAQADHPRMRGVYGDLAGMGFILRDHPRMRGVYLGGPEHGSAAQGSSPHARGLPTRLRWTRLNRRIIPACAGFTLGDPWNPNGPGVYHPPVSFTADLVPARQSCGSAAVEPRWTTTPWVA